MKETKDEKEKKESVVTKKSVSSKASKKAASGTATKSKTAAKKASSSTATKSKASTKKASSSTATKSKTTTKKAASSTATKSKATAKKASSSTATKSKTTTKKAASSTATKSKTTTKKAASSTASKSKTTAKKASSTKSKSTTKTSSVAKSEKKQAEYYDLPYRYNQTVIKILAQTPHSLFIYWDIADSDKKKMEKEYGPNIWTETRPVLLVHNKTLNTSFEIVVDDFTNSWYLHTPTSDCVFDIELGRKIIQENDIIQISKSNTLKSPNDHILKEHLKTVYFKNVKTNELEVRDVSSYNVNSIYNLIDLYNDENGYENNPSSGFKIS